MDHRLLVAGLIVPQIGAVLLQRLPQPGYVAMPKNRQDAWDQIKATDPVWTKLLDLTVEYGRAFSDIRASAELRPLIFEQMTLFLTDQQSLEDTQAALKEEYDGILEAQGYLN